MLQQLTSLGFISTASYPIAGEESDPSALLPFFKSADEDVVVGVLGKESAEPGSSDALQRLLIVNAQFDDTNDTARRKITVNLQRRDPVTGYSVYSWHPVWGDCYAGFGTCSKATLGGIVVVYLLPGEGVYVNFGVTKLTMSDDSTHQ